ncbi:MAG: transporter substrate-binding domain-containing protein [Deltaproteobacteria bacterium]|nr:transporter substrate-binding domain-containing protein [Deltaproteobacteria bacterium]MBW2116984.1 transporter substrate-binding domain-containing protein [Deltaproteobacteria bacterium]MBW2343462.1 transporter substrate-binding domain-containing protein [Deltaproteobacteria bacterium]
MTNKRNREALGQKFKEDRREVSPIKKAFLSRFPVIFAFILFFLYPISTVFALELSKDEQEYLHTKEAIIFISQTRYPPFEFVDRNNEHTGMCIELARWMATEFGFKAKFTDTYFKQAQQDILSGKADVLTSFFYSKKRDKSFDFTQVMFEVPASIFIVAERTDIKDIQDLNGKRVAMQTGDYAKEFLESKQVEFDVVYTKNFAEATDLVIAGRADAIIGDEQIVLYHIFKDNLTEKIKKVGDPLYIGRNCMATKEANRVLISILNKGVKKAQKSGVLEKINRKWIGTHYKLRESLLFKYIPHLSAAAGTLFVLALLVWLWNIKLRHEISKRTEELQKSEEKYRTLIQTLTDGVFIINRDGRFTYLNPEFEKLTGFPAKDFLGHSFTEILAPEYVKSTVDRFKRGLSGETIPIYEVELKHKDGKNVPVELKVTSLLDAEGKAIGRIGLARDIRDRKQAEEVLRVERDNLHNILESIEDGIYIVNQQYDIQYVNPVLVKDFGPYEGQKCYEYFHDRDEICPWCKSQDVWAGKTVHWEWFSFKNDRTYDLMDTPLTLPDGSIGKLEIFRDITERKRAEEEKAKLEAQLQRAQKMEAIGALAGGVAHDLNNVLSAQVSYPDLILMDLPEDSPLRKPILTIQESGKKAADIVQDLLTLARRGVVATEVTSLNQIIKSYLESPECENLKEFYPDAKIGTDLETHLLNIIGSPVHLSKTVMNLVNNAAEAMPDGGNIFIATQNKYIDKPIRGYDDVKEGDYVILTVSDAGVGISSEDIEKIFEPFYTKKVMGRSGTGLGMAVVWGTVKDHKGYIDVHSAKGKGTTFSLYFPVTRKEIAGREEALPMEEYMGKGESILVVDDVEEQKEIASRILTKLNYAVTSVSSGEEAFDYMKDNSADLLVLDMIMDPGIDGLETYKRILELHPGQKAIIASGFSETERVKETQRLGAGKYIKKPYTLEKIGLAVKEELEK